MKKLVKLDPADRQALATLGGYVVLLLAFIVLALLVTLTAALCVRLFMAVA